MKTFTHTCQICCLILFITSFCLSAKAKSADLPAVADTLEYHSSPYVTNGTFASYPGGDIAFVRFLQLHMQPVGNLKVSTAVDTDDKVAEIYVNFQIEKDGKISDVKFSKDVDHQTDVEMVRVIKHSVWKPAVNNGQPVAGGYTMLVVLVNR